MYLNCQSSEPSRKLKKSQRNPGVYYRTVKELDNLRGIDWNKRITSQILMRHKDIPTAVNWVHNRLEKEPTKLARYNYQPKPAGWANGGGGLEKLIRVPQLGKCLTELEYLDYIFPGHPILSDKFLSLEEKIIIAGGIREFLSETGYRDFTIRTDYPGVFLHDYRYQDYVDDKGVFHPGGHRKVTLWGELNSFKVYDKYYTEKHEVDQNDWFDMADSLPGQFFNRAVHPDRPYWSHVLFSLVCMLRIHGYLKSNTDEFTPNIPSRIHPSWWYIRKVGEGDSRFPAGGHRPSPKEWYRLFDHMVANRLEEVSNDFLFEFFKKGIMDSLFKEKEGLDVLPSEAKTGRTEDEAEACENIPTLEEVQQRERQELCKWLEEALDLPYTSRIVKPVA